MPKQRARNSSTYLTRRRWTEDDAREALAAFEDSGLTMAAFVVREGLDPQRLQRWRRVLGAPSRGPEFEEIPRREVLASGAVVAEPEAAGGVLEVVLASGRVVRVSPAFDAPTLRRLLAVLDEAGAC